jgi:hypothetical protein
MARREILVDDLDGTESTDDGLVQARRFSVGRQGYTIDLNDKNFDKLLKALEPFIEVASKDDSAPAAPRSVRATRGTSGTAKASNASQIRSWAASQGIGVAPRGRIHADVVAKWEAAGRP